MLSTKLQERRATSLKLIHRTGSGSNLKKNSTLSLKRNSHNFTDEPLFHSEKKRLGGKAQLEDPEAMLDAQIAKIRGDLDIMRVEHRTMAARVHVVRCRLDSVASSDTSSRNNSTDSLEMICESGDGMEREDPSADKSSSTNSLNFKRDSGYVFDPVFEIDNRKITIPNNAVSLSSLPKKARSTSALDFIKNNLYEDEGEHLKATSCDRISCYSDSAILTIRGFKPIV